MKLLASVDLCGRVLVVYFSCVQANRLFLCVGAILVIKVMLMVKLLIMMVVMMMMIVLLRKRHMHSVVHRIQLNMLSKFPIMLVLSDHSERCSLKCM